METDRGWVHWNKASSLFHRIGFDSGSKTSSDLSAILNPILHPVKPHKRHAEGSGLFSLSWKLHRDCRSHMLPFSILLKYQPSHCLQCSDRALWQGGYLPNSVGQIRILVLSTTDKAFHSNDAPANFIQRESYLKTGRMGFLWTPGQASGRLWHLDTETKCLEGK